MRKVKIFFTLLLLAAALQKLGSLSNHVVFDANGGVMPVINFSSQVAEQQDSIHTVLNANSKDWALCDLFIVPLFYWGGFGWEVLSIGDIMVDAGNYLFLFLPLLVLKWIVRR